MVRGDASVNNVQCLQVSIASSYWGVGTDNATFSVHHVDDPPNVTGAPTRILDDGHGFVFLCVGGSHCTPGVRFRLSFGDVGGGYATAGKPWVWAMAGDVVPIPPDLGVWIEAWLGPAALKTVADQYKAHRDYLVWLTPPGVHPPVFRRPYLKDELVHRLFSSSLTETGSGISSGKLDSSSEIEIAHFDTVNEFAGLALRCEVMIEGGIMGASDYPLELVYHNPARFGEATGGQSLERTFLFPGLPEGEGAAHISINLPVQSAFPEGRTPTLVVRNPGASARAYEVWGGLYVGHRPEFAHYPSCFADSPSSPGTDTFLSLGVTRLSGASPLPNGRVAATAGGQTLRCTMLAYVPTSRQGPDVSMGGQQDVTDGSYDELDLSGVHGRHLVFKFNYVVAPASPSMAFTLSP